MRSPMQQCRIGNKVQMPKPSRETRVDVADGARSRGVLSLSSCALMTRARLHIMLSPEELRVLDSFRFQHRMPSRAAIIFYMEIVSRHDTAPILPGGSTGLSPSPMPGR